MQGGAQSKPCVLGCDPGAGHERAILRGIHARLRARIPEKGAAVEVERGSQRLLVPGARNLNALTA